MSPWQRVADRLERTDSFETADAAVVLGGAPRYRAPTAARLLRAGRVRVVLAVGGPRGAVDEAWRTLAVLRSLGLREDQVVALPAPAPGTAEEARAAVGWAVAAGISSLAVVTSAYHTRRAGRLFRRRAAPHGVVVRVVAAEDDPFTPERWWTDPRARRLVGAEYVKHALWAMTGRHR